ncbi:MAG: helix-turn-helix domain-containing protein [Bacilli bacterium]
MSYGYFKPQYGGNLQKGSLEGQYKYLKRIPNIRVYYDHYGKGSPHFSNLMKKLSEGDSLYVTNVRDLGKTNNGVFTNFLTLKSLKVNLFINDKKIDIDGLFNEIDTMKKFNYAHTKGQLRDIDIVDATMLKYIYSFIENKGKKVNFENVNIADLLLALGEQLKSSQKQKDSASIVISKELLSSKEVCELYPCFTDDNALRKATDKGLPYLKTGRHRFYRRIDIDGWLDKQIIIEGNQLMFD